MSRPLSKKDIKEVFVETLEPFAKSVQLDFKKVHGRLDGLESGLQEVKNNMRELKVDIKEMTRSMHSGLSLSINLQDVVNGNKNE